PVAQPTEIHTVSPSRRKPSCDYVNDCGGCDWQHMTHPAQLQAKKDIYIDCLQRNGRLREIPPMQTFSAHEWNYRLRVQLKVNPAQRTRGFYRRGTNEIVNLNGCRLLAERLNRLLHNTNLLFSNLPPSTTELKAICGSDGSLASYPRIDGYTSDRTLIETADSRLAVSGKGFFQSNRYLLEPLGKWAGPWLEGTHFVDLYGGGGFFSVMLGGSFTGGLCIDNDFECIALAQENIRVNELPHISAQHVSAENYLRNRCQKEIDCVIVDPPRPGLTRNARRGIASLNPRIILYVSCNPSTQARDIGYFVNRKGYSIFKTALFDLYPQTHHMETAALLCK
ncbi:MAG: hypothetical protein GF350_04840, partial [Chitinivibrionales bacterium]|nr:hypothetical protein [Chitinivibrionales bacterium]